MPKPKRFKRNSLVVLENPVACSGCGKNADLIEIEAPEVIRYKPKELVIRGDDFRLS